MDTSFSYLDQDQFRELYCEKENSQQMKFFVEGIRCAKCVQKIESLKNSNQEIESVEVDLANQVTLVRMKDVKGSFDRVACEISDLGFRPVPIQPEDDINVLWQKEARKDIVRLGVAGAIAGNVMMLAFASYFGLDGSLQTYFEWTQWALCLPVVTYVAWPFYKGFIEGLRSKSLSIDGPMAIASSMGFLVSSYNLFFSNRLHKDIYFDSISGFLFLILATRFIQKKTRFQYLKYLRPSSLAETFKARLCKDEVNKDVINKNAAANWSWVPSSQLKEGDSILVQNKDWFPADGHLVSDRALVDLSVLNGESAARLVQKGFLIRAGARLLSEDVHLQVKATGTKTVLGQLLSSLKRDSFEETSYSKLSNKASQYLLLIVLSIALLVLAWGFYQSGMDGFHEQFRKSFALIIIACPCAMAFGTPLAFAFSLKHAQDKGIIIKNPKVFEDLESIDTVLLDKTGTLTERNWNLHQSSLSEAESLPYKQIILSLEAQSQHPIAFALRDLWSDIKISAPVVTVWKEIEYRDSQQILSKGVEGIIGTTKWRFTSFTETNSDSGQQKWFALWKTQSGNAESDLQIVWKFKLEAALQVGAKATIEKMKKAGFHIYLLSGDTKSEAQRMATLLEISPDQVFAELTPEDKKQIVLQHPNSIMIGDGYNDSLALQQARVGIAVKGGVDLALKSADVFFLEEGLSSLHSLLRISAKARRQIHANLLTAIVYNSLGGLAAIFGLVNPFVAALFMPVSSIFILASTWMGTKE